MSSLDSLKALKNSKHPEDTFTKAHKLVEEKLSKGVVINADELRKWFIKDYELYYNTKMLGTNIHYCYKTFNAVKTRLNMCNNELAKNILIWRERYHKLGYDFGGTAKFDFSVLNTDWLLDNLINNIPCITVPNTTYKKSNTKIDTSNRRRK